MHPPMVSNAIPFSVLIAALLGLLALGGFLAFLIVTLSKDAQMDASGQSSKTSNRTQDGSASRQGGAARMRAGAARRRRAAAQGGGARLVEEDAAAMPGSGSDSDGDGVGGGGFVGGGGRDARRAAKKRDKREEREERRQAEQDSRDKKDSRAAKYDDKRRQKDLEREQAEREAEEELERRAQAQAKQEQQEYDEWKGMFAVEEGGSVEDQIASESQGLLGEFVQYIERRKTVVLEELAAHFGLRTQDVIHRVHALESMGRLTGVMDDRGKYIFVSKQEMEAVADYIKRTGRISIAELANKSNEFIDLSAPEVIELTEEERSAMDNDAACVDEDIDVSP